MATAEAVAVLQDERTVTQAMDAVAPEFRPTAAEFIARGLEIQPLPGTTLLRVHVTLEDPEASRKAAERLIAEAAALEARRRAAQSLLETETVKKKLLKVSDQLERLSQSVREGRHAGASGSVPEAVREAQLELELQAAQRLYSDLVEEGLRIEADATTDPRIHVVGVLPPTRINISPVQAFALGLITGLIAATILAGVLRYGRLSPVGIRESVV
jgi:hypothetical protein